MKKTLIFAILTLALLLVAGCQSEPGNGYATYSGGAGNPPAASGGGGCGRFAAVAEDPCAQFSSDNQLILAESF